MAEPTDPVAVVRRLIEALRARDPAALAEVLAEDAVYHFPGRSRLAGTYRGRAAILEVFRRFGDALGPVEVRTHDLLRGEGHVAELAINAAERDGRRFEWRAIRVYHVRGETVAEVWVMLEDPYAFDAFVAG